MEQPQPLHFSSTVDTSRPFSSVKEAVAIFGERLLVGEIYSPSPKPPFSDTTTALYSPATSIKREPSWRSFSSSPTPPSPIKLSKQEENNNSNTHGHGHIMDTVKKLEEELEKTKAELKLLKERGSETEVALATLNAELHKNMSKLAQAEAVAAGKAAVATKTVRFEINGEEEDQKKRDREYIRSRMMGDSQTLAQIISHGENDHIFGGKKKVARKKQKPIIPLVGDLLFFRRKTSSTNHHNPLYASPF